ncbi:MAG: DNA-directed RNA polymerase subunit omega [Pyrinomonadaceae bacterium]
MSVISKKTGSVFSNAPYEEEWPGVDSRFRLIVVAAQRAKQLQRGATPRIGEDSLKRRNTSIALEEVKQGLVPFTTTKKVLKGDGDEDGASHGTTSE